MKTLILAALTALTISCSWSRREIHHASSTDLQLRRYQTMYRIQHDAGDDDTLEEKEYIEKELAHRGQLDYRSRPHVVYGGAGDDW